MKLNSIFSDGAVFLRNFPIRVFGEGDGEIEFLGETRKTTGDFCVEFSPHDAGGPYEMHIKDENGERTVKNIMVGEVIFLAGQSNAELTIAETYDRNTVFEQDETVRYFAPTRPDSDENGNLMPLDTPYNEKWNTLTAENASDWSAIALHVAKYFSKKLKTAVGVVTCFKGAAVIQSFLGEAENAKFPRDEEKMMSDHFDPLYVWNKPSFIYDYMLKKLAPYGIGTAIWYQGESNRSEYEAEFYDKMLISLAKQLREMFKNPKLPFVPVQINLFDGDESPNGNIAIRKAQERATKELENCRLVRIDDLGEHEKIHPENKKEVSERICRAIEELNSYFA